MSEKGYFLWWGIRVLGIHVSKESRNFNGCEVGLPWKLISITHSSFPCFFFFFFSDIRVSELFLEFPIYGFRDSDFIHPSTLKNFVLGTTDSHPAQ